MRFRGRYMVAVYAGMSTLGVRDLEEVAPGRRVKRFCGVSGEVEGHCVVSILEECCC